MVTIFTGMAGGGWPACALEDPPRLHPVAMMAAVSKNARCQGLIAKRGFPQLPLCSKKEWRAILPSGLLWSQPTLAPASAFSTLWPPVAQLWLASKLSVYLLRQLVVALVLCGLLNGEVDAPPAAGATRVQKVAATQFVL